MTVLSIDLFSGIGGMQLALRGYTKTVLYCDIDKYCSAVLSERISDGSLDPAPIHSDIKNLHLSPHFPNVQMICGGFPCVDLSSIGLQNGIKEGTHSGLFLQVVRLIDESPFIKVLFLENVSNIVRVGMKEVLDELTKRNFTCIWTMKSAGSLGAPHLRNRWFLLATRDNFDINNFHADADTTHSRDALTTPFLTHWNEEPQRRFSFKPSYTDVPDDSFDPNWILRSGTLGNTVCPFAVRCAFEELVNLHKNVHHITSIFTDYSIPYSSLNYPYPASGVIHNNYFFSLPDNVLPQISFLPKITIKHNNKCITLKKFPTPRHGVTHASSITDRSLKDLPTILVHCEESRDLFKSFNVDSALFPKLHTIAVPNVNYIEWMMGYPKDWTKVSSLHCRNPTNTSNRRPLPSVANDTDSIDSTDSSHSIQNVHVPKTKRNTLNGMHIFMRENSNKGKTISQISQLWSQLSNDIKALYRHRAAVAREAAVFREASSETIPEAEDDQV